MPTKQTYSREETIEWLLRNTLENSDGCKELIDDFWYANNNGYPSICWNGKFLNICRFICFEPDEWKSNLVTRHRCHNKKCIEPTHLIKGTNSDNLRDNGYAPFEMPEFYDSIFSQDHDGEWWDEPKDAQKEKEYKQYLEEMIEEQQEYLDEINA